MAAALGFGTHAHLRSALDGAPAGPNAEFILLCESRFFSRLSDLGWPKEDDGLGAFYGLLPLDGTVLVDTEPQSSFDIEYKTERQRAWRNLMVSAVNAGLDRQLFTLRPGDNRWPGATKDQRSTDPGCVYEFTFDGDVPGLAWVGDAGFDELSFHAALWPKQSEPAWITASNAGFLAGEVFGDAWIERRKGAWLQTCDKGLRCRRGRLGTVASAVVKPRGYGDRGRVIL